MSQLDLAYGAGVALGTVNALERRLQRPHPSTARKLSEALEVAIPELFPELFDE